MAESPGDGAGRRGWPQRP